ncbi:unnamed protein product, partial [Ceratitis capitata]
IILNITAVVEFAYEQLLDIYVQNNRSASSVSSWIYDELKEFDLSTEQKDEINTK